MPNNEQRVRRAYTRCKNALEEASEEARSDKSDFDEFDLDRFLANPQSPIIDPIEWHIYRNLRDRVRCLIRELERYRSTHP